MGSKLLHLPGSWGPNYCISQGENGTQTTASPRERMGPKLLRLPGRGWGPNYCIFQGEEVRVQTTASPVNSTKIRSRFQFLEVILLKSRFPSQLIFSKSYTQAEGCNWHLKHFCCFECDKKLGGEQYVVRENPYCLACYEILFAKKCGTCGNVIAADDKRLCYKENFWHATDECFHCSNCSLSLVGKEFLPKGSNAYCSAKCYKQHRGQWNMRAVGYKTSSISWVKQDDNFKHYLIYLVLYLV